MIHKGFSIHDVAVHPACLLHGFYRRFTSFMHALRTGPLAMDLLHYDSHYRVVVCSPTSSHATCTLSARPKKALRVQTSTSTPSPSKRSHTTYPRPRGVCRSHSTRHLFPSYAL